MSQELIYTSAPRGLKPGSHGFCTVVNTAAMPLALSQRLESLSGYRHVFGPQDPNARLNPVLRSHLVLNLSGRRLHVLSRICDAGLDHTQRTNKFAHHVVLDQRELPPAGPAWLLAAPGFMQAAWDGVPKVLPTGRQSPTGNAPAAVCRAWQQAAGDAGWGGALADTANGNRPAIIVYRPGLDLLPLLAEALALLPAEQRWNVSFSTYYSKLPPGIDCQWRCLVEGSPEAEAGRPAGTLVVDLTRSPGRPPESAMAQAARTGVVPRLPVAAPRQAVAAGGHRPGDAGPSRMQGESAAGAAAAAASGARPVVQSSSAAQADTYDIAIAPPPAEHDAMGLPPALRQFKRKPKSYWPIYAALGTMAAILIIGVAGIMIANGNRQIAREDAGEQQSPATSMAPGQSAASARVPVNSAEPQTKPVPAARDSGQAARQKQHDDAESAATDAKAEESWDKASAQVALAESSGATARQGIADAARLADRGDVGAAEQKEKAAQTAIEAAESAAAAAEKIADDLQTLVSNAKVSSAHAKELKDKAILHAKSAREHVNKVHGEFVALDGTFKEQVRTQRARADAMAEVLSKLAADEVLALPEYKGRAVDASLQIATRTPLRASDYSLQLVGANDVFPKDFKVRFGPSDTSPTVWNCSLTVPGDDKPKAIARFYVKDDKLCGSFLASGLPPENCDLMRDCLLRISDSKSLSSKPALLRLRREEGCDAIPFKFLGAGSPDSTSPIQLRLEGVPRATAIFVDAAIVGDISDFEKSPDSTGTTISTKPPLPLHFHVSGFRPKDMDRYQITLEYKGLDQTDSAVFDSPNKRPRSSSLVHIGVGAMKRIRDDLVDALQQAAQDLANDGTKPEKKQELREKTAGWQKQREQLAKLIDTYGKIQESKLEYRVFIKVAGNDIDLFKTKGLR